MRKIINNRQYDTDKAEQVDTWDNGDVYGDLDYVAQTLYRKRTGEYFIHSEGGARTQYAESRGSNSWVAGEMIDPLSIDDARSWLEEHGTADEYEAEFGAVEEDDTKVLKGYSLPRATAERIARTARERGISQSQLVDELAAML